MATIRHELDPELEAITRPEDRERLYRGIHVLLANGKPLRTGVTRDDLIGAFVIFCLVFATTLPAVLPFLFVRDPWLALRMSNLLLIGCVFIVGFHWARYINANPWLAAWRSPVSAWRWSPSRWPWGADPGHERFLRK